MKANGTAILAALLPKLGKGGEKADKAESEGDDAADSESYGASIDDAAQAMLDAIESKDASALASALRDAFACCHDEMTSESSEEEE